MTDKKRGYVKGQPRRFVRGHQTRGRKQARKTNRVVAEDRGYATPCLIWQLSLTEKGYGNEWNPRLQRMDFAHRVAWEEVHGPIPPDKEIDHLCRVRSCRNVDHLEAVTHLVNLERGPRPKIADEVANRAMELLALGLLQREVAAAVGISRQSVSRIARGPM